MPVYLDCNATTPLDPDVREALLEAYSRGPSNAGSRTHSYGAEAKRAVEYARALIGAVVRAQPEEVILTSGATEANNLAILGLAPHGSSAGRKHIISTQIEHKAVLEPLQALVEQGFEVELLPVGTRGWVEPSAVAQALRPDTLLVSVMHVNNETGVIQPLDQISDVLGGHASFFHVDAAQGFGKFLPDLLNPRIDLLSVSAHKLYAPQGIGALIARRRGFRRVPLAPLMYGGGQERGLRPGTLPVPLVVAFGRAAEIAVSSNRERMDAYHAFRRTAVEALAPLRPIFHGDPERAAPHVINVTFPGVDAEALMLSLKGIIAFSNGSACTSNSYRPSHVLTAMGLCEDEIAGSVRLSWSHLTEFPDWARICEVIRRLQAP
jgi:cysteine desulfurase